MRSSRYNQKIVIKTIALVFFIFFINVADAKNIAFLYALDSDWKQFVADNDSWSQTRKINGINIHQIDIGEITVYGLRMGSGVVTTAVSTQALIGSINVDLVISTGPVGAFSADNELNKIVIATEVVAWQTVGDIRSAAPTNFNVLKPNTPSGDWSFLMQRYTETRVASGDAFVKDSELRAAIQIGTAAEVVDMNLYGLLSALERRKIPSIHLRIVSDYANEDAIEDFSSFRSNYSGILGLIVSEVVNNLPEDATDPDSYPELKELFKKPE